MIVSKKHRGRDLKVVYNVPCDTCSLRNSCKINGTYCAAFTEFVNYSWYDITKIGKRLKRL